MTPIDPSIIIQYTALALVGIGFLVMLIGIIVMARKSFAQEMKDVTKEVSRLAKKGILSDMNGTMESASFLVREMTTMLQTAMGIGFALVIIGAILLAAGLVILYKIPA